MLDPDAEHAKSSLRTSARGAVSKMDGPGGGGGKPVGNGREYGMGAVAQPVSANAASAPWTNLPIAFPV
jgi:hypothetical protein